MNKFYTCILLALLFSFVKDDSVQAQAIKWQKCLGGTAADIANDVLINPDGTLIVVGSTSSNDGDVSGNHGGGDAWIVKLDSSGNIIWQKAIGGTGSEYFNKVISTDDNAYLCLGYTTSNDGDVSGNHGGGDAWIVKISVSGVIMWSKCYGGTKFENIADGQLADDGGYAIMGTSWSYDGDVLSGVNGRPDSDGWAFKINANGNIQWEKCINHNFTFLKPSNLHNDIGYNITRSEDGNYYALVSGSEDYQSALWPDYDTVIRTPGILYKLDKNTGSSSVVKNIGGDYNFAMHKTPAGLYFSYVYKEWYYLSHCFDETAYITYKADTSNTLQYVQTMEPAHCDWGNHAKTWFAGTNGITTPGAISSYIAVGETENENSIGGNGYNTDALLDLAGIKRTYGGDKLNGFGNFSTQSFNSVKSFPAGDEFIVVGYTNSVDGDASGLHGGVGGPSDCWILRLTVLNRITGNVFVDLNNNNIKDPGEPPFNHAVAKTTKPGFQLYGIPYNGVYNNTVDLGTFTTVLGISNPYYTVTPASKVSTFSTYKNVDSANFAVHPIPGIIDYAVSTISLLPARPGFPLQYKIVYTNKGTTTLTNKEVRFVKDTRTHYINAVPAFTSMSGDTIKWNIATLDPEGTGNIILNMELDPIPIVSFNDTLISNIYIDSTADIFTANNSVSLRQMISYGYDPNDKKENLGGFITPQELAAGKYLNYTIRFQNTGNDTAFNIIVRDTLDSKLEWDSIEVIASSHPYQFNIKNGQYATWTFNNIKLVDSIHNEPLSHGYISYRIKPKSTLVLGDTIRNSASIYFDFNPAVPTNTELTIVRTKPVPVKWTGTVSTAWEDPVNWNNAKLPDANTDIIIDTGVPNYPIVNSNAVCRSLHVKTGASVLIKTGYTLKVIH